MLLDMKRLIYIPLLAVAMTTAAQNTATREIGREIEHGNPEIVTKDSVRRITFYKPYEVILKEGDNSVSITVKGLKGNQDYRYTYETGIYPGSGTQTTERVSDFDFFNWDILRRPEERRTKKPLPNPRKGFFYDGLKYLMLGWANTAKDVTGMSVSPRFCSDLTINVFQWGYASYSRKKRVGWSVSASLDWSYYSLRSTDNRFVRTNDATLLQTFPVEWSSASSAFRYNTFTLPVRLNLRLDECRLYAGPALDFNFNGRIRDKYNVAGDSKKDRTPDVRLEPISFHVEGGLRWKDFGIYCKWNPCKVLKGGASPDIQTISFGFILGNI